MKIEEELGRLLKEHSLKIAAAESFTGGLFSKRLTDIPGSSDYFVGSIVAYSYFAKEHVLEIPGEVLVNKGAVSKETALLMAKNVKKIFLSDIGISFTGVAGPATQENKPIGLIYIGIAIDKDTKIFELHFKGTRDIIRKKAADFTINKIIKIVGGRL